MAKPETQARNAGPRAAAAMIALGAALLLATPAAATLERAQQAQARGDLRTAQIELRNAIRATPQAAAPRAALAELSLELGDADVAEREARAAMERGFDAVAGTRIVLRAYLMLNRHRDLLRDFPVPTDPARAALGGQIAAARALAQLAMDDRAAARASVEQAVQLAPNAPDPHLAAASLAIAERNQQAAEAAVDRALAADPTNVEATLRKAGLVFQRGQPAQAAELLAPLVARVPANIPARILRADALMRAGNDAAAREEVEAAIRLQPGNAAANYLRGLLLGRAGDWRGADEVFQRIGSALANFPDGFLVAATARRAVGQIAQAEDLAGRHVARSPEDPRGARLLAAMQLESNRPEAAAGVLQRLVDRGGADAEAFDMLARALGALRRMREAVVALERAVALSPNDSALRTRLSAARLASGDVLGAAEAAGEAERLAPDQTRVREVIAAGAIARGDLTAAEAELARLDPAQRNSEVAGVLAATIRLGRLDLPGARQGFEQVLRANPESIGARLGLARVLAAGGDIAAAEQLWAEVLRRDPQHPEATARLAALARPGGPRAASARAAMEAAQAANPTVIAPSLALAQSLAVGGDLAGAARLLETDAMRQPGRGPVPPLLRSQVYAGQERWAEAEAEARSALAEAPDNIGARRQLALLMARSNRGQDAEALVQDGLRRRPGEIVLQQTLVALVNQSRGEAAALALADQLARQPAAQPASRSLRGDFLLSLNRQADAAAAYAAAFAETPSSVLALRQAQAWRQIGQPERAAAALETWLRREPNDMDALDLLGNVEIELGRTAQARQRLETVVERAPLNAISLNNLAWLLAASGDASVLPRARNLAERGYYLLPTAQSADTLGWVLTLSGDPARALPLLRQAAAATRATPQPDRGILYRFARTLAATGDRAEALSTVEAALEGTAAFPEREAAERLRTELRAGR
jgi:putative PEP-CTERM system TPR-repeat lipoprotein